MRSYASAYKICGEVSPAESQRDGPIALCALPDYRNQRYRTRSGSASGDGVSSYLTLPPKPVYSIIRQIASSLSGLGGARVGWAVRREPGSAGMELHHTS